MGIYFDEPKYPVIDKAPGFWKTGTCAIVSLYIYPTPGLLARA